MKNLLIALLLCHSLCNAMGQLTHRKKAPGAKEPQVLYMSRWDAEKVHHYLNKAQKQRDDNNPIAIDKKDQKKILSCLQNNLGTKKDTLEQEYKEEDSKKACQLCCAIIGASCGCGCIGGCLLGSLITLLL